MLEEAPSASSKKTTTNFQYHFGRFLHRSWEHFSSISDTIIELRHLNSCDSDTEIVRVEPKGTKEQYQEAALPTTRGIMSGENQTLVVCPQEDAELVDQFAIGIGVLTVLGSIIGYFVQQYRDRQDAAEAKIKEDEDLDRQQALQRARKQLSVLVGPLHRLWKTQIIMIKSEVTS